MENTDSENLQEPKWQQTSQFDIAKQIIKTAKNNYIEISDNYKKLKKEAKKIDPDDFEKFTKMQQDLKDLEQAKFNAMFTLAEARKKLIHDAPEVSEESKKETLKEAGLDKRHPKLGRAVEIGFGLIGVEVNSKAWFDKKVGDFEAKMKAKECKDKALADPATQEMVKFFQEQGLTNMKAVPGKNGGPPTLKFSGKDPDRDIHITFNNKGEPKGIKVNDPTSANVDLFTKSLSKLREVKSEIAQKDGTTPPKYTVKSDEKFNKKIEEMNENSDDKYSKKYGDLKGVKALSDELNKPKEKAKPQTEQPTQTQENTNTPKPK